MPYHRRRRLLLQSLAVGLAPLAGRGGAVPLQTGKDFADEPALRALLDTLIPADRTPAATALGIDRALLALARRNEDYRTLLAEGLAWLERTAGALGAKSFAAATEDQRIGVVRRAERSREQTPQRRMFERVRYDAMRLYYSEPATWAALGYFGPPQPAGFADFEQPPARQ